MQQKELINIISETINKQIDILSEKIEVNNHIKNIITEEYGVSFDIEKLTFGICGLIKKQAKTIEKTYDGLNVPHKYGVVKTKAFDQPLTIDFDIIMFKDEKTFDLLASQYNYTSSYNKDSQTIYLTIAMINGKYLSQGFTDSIQHELSHIYDFFSYGDNFLSNDDELYHKATKVFSNGKKTSKEYQLALCIYLSFKTEQIAHANSFDNMVSNMKRLNLDMAREFKEYQYLYVFHHVIEHFYEYEDICLNLFNKTPEYILKFIKKGYSEYSRRIGRIFTKNQIREMKNYIL